MRDILVVIDMQNDFITGTLGTKEAIAVQPEVVKIVEQFQGEILFTRDTHEEDYLTTREGKNLPIKHCIRNTNGWEIEPELKSLAFEKGCRILDKPTFGSVELMEYLKQLNDQDPISTLTFVGVCTDICVISNVLLAKAALLNTEIKVIKDACAGVTKESHENALMAMKACQIEII
ncbi:nicotinamidase [Lachnospiraceae bacterium KM106-2]|nr:nicotinamidase [Lachnospiraceae bacterium KM106-2]